MIKQVCDLRVGGTGAGVIDTTNPRNPDGQITLGYVFDGNSRLTGIVDDNGNRTSFGYDALSRRKSQTNADGESYTFTFDKDDNIRTVTDPNGSVITKTYDALNRLTAVGVARGLGVVGTSLETYSYDGVSRLVRATDDNGAPAATQATEWTYDSLGRLVEERQNGHAISSRYSGDGKRTQVTYPGGRTITRTFDALDRIVDLKQGSQTIATSDWIGPGLRELRRTNNAANGTVLSFMPFVDAQGQPQKGYDEVQRLVNLRVLDRHGNAIVHRQYGYNRASQRTSEKRHDDFGLTDTYTYDSAYRIVASSYDQFGLPGAVARDLTNVSYVMDGVGNRRDVAKNTASGPVAESYSVNAVNEYVSVAGVARTHDDNGNLTDDGTKLLAFDYKNRLVMATRKADLRPVALYSYLPDGRRSRKQVWNPDTNTLVKDVRFLSDGAQEVEEQDWSTGVTTATYVWSPVYVDELVSYTNSAGTFYAHQDARCDVVAVTNASGSVVERRRYDDFGKEEIRSPLGAVLSTSPSGLEYGFQGRRLDPETGLVFFRARYYSPETGRFVQRDPVWDAGNVGGQYSFCGNGPASGRDPGGEQYYSSAAQDAANERYQALVQEIDAETQRTFGPRQDRLDSLLRRLESTASEANAAYFLDQYRGETGDPRIYWVQPTEPAPTGPSLKDRVEAGMGEAFVPGYGMDLSSPGLDPRERAGKALGKSREFVIAFGVGAGITLTTGPLLDAVVIARGLGPEVRSAAGAARRGANQVAHSGWKGRNFALGLTERLPALRQTLGEGTTLGWLEAYDEKLIRGMIADPEIWKGNFRFIVNQVIKEGGRLKFALDGVSPCRRQTFWELGEILADPEWLAKTDFYLGGSQITGEALDAALNAIR